MLDAIIGAIATAALGMAGWAIAQVFKIPTLEEDVRYIRTRLDALYDHLIGE